MTESFYDVLGVATDASDEEIRRAYREKLKDTHPDVSDDPDAGVHTKRLVEAKETLLDPAERDRYDRLGHDAYVGATGGGSQDSGTDVPGGAGADGSSVDRDAWTDREDGSGGPTNDRTGPWERRARERRARERVETEAGPASKEDGGGSESVNADDVGTDGSTSTGGPSGGATDGFDRTGGTADRGGPSASGGGRTPPWSASRIDVDVEPGDVRDRGPWLTIEESSATVVAAVALYPVLVAGAVLPSFPLSVNVVVGICTVAVIAALQSMPGVGMIVFGAWALGGSVGLAAAGLSPFSVIGIVVVGATWFPLGLTVLTYRALQF